MLVVWCSLPICRKGDGLEAVLPKGKYEESTRVFARALMQNCLLDKVLMIDGHFFNSADRCTNRFHPVLNLLPYKYDSFQSFIPMTDPIHSL